jgi:hypothetical protein
MYKCGVRFYDSLDLSVIGAGPVSGDAVSEIEKECLHAPPEPGETVSPCCGRSLDQLPRYDRIVREPDLVTCGHLTPAEEAHLSGQPVILDPANEQLIFTMTATVASLCGSAMTLQTAYECVTIAIREILSDRGPLRAWSAPLMIQVTDRARELALRT